MIKVLIVEDSPVVQELLVHILGSQPDIQVVGIVDNGQDALPAVKQTKPDVVTMDIHMPRMDGFQATRQIMETHPTPIVIVSGSSTSQEATFSFKAIEAGALAVVPRPPGLTHPDHEATVRELIQTVKLMSEIKVVTRKTWPQVPPSIVVPAPLALGNIQIVAIGASTGGPVALQQILSGLPMNLPFPLLIVQHISAGFVRGFVDWLAEASRFPLLIASHGERPRPGQGYVAPDGFHLGVGAGPRLVLSDHAPENSLRPSVAYLFRTVAAIFGPQAVGVLLTGMGSDGARELLLMRQKGAITIAQDKDSSVIHGMPGVAIGMDAATHVLPPEGISAMLVALAEQTNGVGNDKPE
ncbi:MAG: chemotaxis-specific protein-glutamate methyltransferase CheB [Pseudomonadota bacterium]